MISSFLKYYISKLIYFFNDFSFLRLFFNKPMGNAIVLCYHRVMPDSFFSKHSPLNPLVVSVSNFERHMRYLSKNYNIISFDDLYKPFTSTKTPLVITFDDGYLDNLTNALPILEKYNIPATIYITTKFLKGDGRMWWYELWDNIEKKSKIEFSHEGKIFNFNTNNYFQKLYCFKKLRKYILSLNSNKINSFIDEFSENEIDYINICLNKTQVKYLSSHKLITIGAHTINHPNLNSLTNSQMENEISESKYFLEKLLNIKVKHFAYPFGTIRECKQREHDAAKKIGFNTAATTYLKPFFLKNENKFSIPRIIVENFSNNSLRNHINGVGYFLSKFY